MKAGFAESSYACIEGLMSPLGSCLMAGETMAGWGMPVWWRLCGGGVTMWGEKRLDTKLGGQKGGNVLTAGCNSVPLSAWHGIKKRSSANLAHNRPASPSGWNSLCLLPPSRLNSYTQWVTCFLFCSNKDVFKRPFIHQRLKKSGVCCYHGNGRAVTPETSFLTTSQTAESALTAVHTEHLYKVFLSISSS